MTYSALEFPVYVPAQPVAFVRDNVCFGGTWHDGEAMGGFGVTRCQAQDPRGALVRRSGRRFGMAEPHEAVVDGFVLVFALRRGVSALPAGWFFDDAQGARDTARHFCLWVARWLANSFIASVQQAADRPALLAAIARGDVPVWLVNRHKNKLMRIASRHGVVMGPNHDLRALYACLDHRALRAIERDELSGPTSSHFVEQTGRTTAFPVPQKSIVSGGA